MYINIRAILTKIKTNVLQAPHRHVPTHYLENFILQGDQKYYCFIQFVVDF